MVTSIKVFYILYLVEARPMTVLHVNFFGVLLNAFSDLFFISFNAIFLKLLPIENMLLFILTLDPGR